MLSVEPIGRISASNQLEISLISQTPNDIPSSSTVVVVDFDHPTLVPHGDEYVSIVFRVDDRICMGPVWKVYRMPIDIKVVKLIPHPNRIQVRVQIDDYIA